MQELLYYDINLEKQTRRYHINYFNVLTTYTTFEKLGKSVSNWQHMIDNVINFGIENSKDAKDVVDVSYDGFNVDMKKMEPYIKYFLSYFDSQYVLIKNDKNELEVHEVG